MKHECPKCGKETEDELDVQEVYEQDVQNYMDYKFQEDELDACRNER